MRAHPGPIPQEVGDILKIETISLNNFDGYVELGVDLHFYTSDGSSLYALPSAEMESEEPQKS
jgi:hypothetical protein